MKKAGNHLAYVLVLLWVAITGLGAPQILQAESLPIAVFYPQIREPYRSIFFNIIQGIEHKHNGPIYIYALDKNFNIKKIKENLEKERVQVVITLGRRGLLAAKQLQRWFKVVVGAVLMLPNNEGLVGISLIPDPKKLFQKLKVILPKIKRVTVIYGEKRSQWFINYVRKSAEAHNLEINAFVAKDLQQKASLYRKILGELQSETDAIWLPYDKIANEQAFLPLILQKSWDQRLAVFSSNLAAVKRGALFTLYPDNVAMGRSLAELALKQVKKHSDILSGIRPLRDLFGAINTRTAGHLGVFLTYRQIRMFDLFFPLR